MGLGTSLFLIAVGAILRYAVHVTTKGFSLHTIGDIPMVVGVIGLAIWLFWMMAWARRRDRVVPAEDRYAPRRRPPADYAP